MTAVDPVRRLEAIDAIRTLRARYWRFVDTKRWAEFRELFADDAVFIDHSADMHFVGGDGITDTISAIATADVRSIHQGHQHEITVVDEDHASGIWAMHDYVTFAAGTEHPTKATISAFHGYGHYFDDYVKVDGAWRFSRIELHRLRFATAGASSTVYPSR